ncbi:Sds3-like protein [Ophiocordyceps sinensis CO18]|uniref:Sds3-like protein n=1 Tax=Ophiocordyceps sinensis (strain Co18 / CGMCC 3.14243) TaxID=911162 RepID=T5ACN9_OPHSC|nr:Sds3-like protein [Ophiocordyceps sinensis CO18]
MAATAVAHGARSPSGPGAVDLEGSVVSSPLSEVDDGDANDDEIEHMQLDGRGHIARKASLSGDDDHIANHDGSDSDSALSDAASDVNSDVNDTEAETERLYDTPKNQRHRDVVVDQFNNGQVFEHTPSKLRRTPGANADMNIRDDLDLSVSGDEESAASSLAGREDSPTKPATTNDTSIDEDAQLDSHERKRKRSPVVDPAELDQPLRKRNGSLEAPGATVEQDTPMNEDDTTSANPRSRHQSGDEDETSSLSNRGVPVEASGRETRKSKRNSSKRKGLLAGEAAGGADSDTREDPADVAVEDDPEHPRDEVDGDAEEEADIAAKNIEETERKHAAFKDWTHIEGMFSVFRERLYKDRLQRLEEEEQSLLADEPTHPEYLSMKKCIDDRLNKRLQEADAEFQLQMRAHDRRAVAERAQTWSQFFQAVREKREQALERLNQQWYEVQSARRSAHSLPDYGLLFPKDPAQRLRNAIAYNTEVSTLAGLAKYEGFPAGPELKGASMSELEADLTAIEHIRLGRRKQTPHHQSRDDYHTPTFSRLGPAGEQFIKDTPWANPNHSSHKMHKEPAQTDGPAKRATHPANGPPPADVKAAFDGHSTAHISPALPNRVSESPEMTRGIPNQVAHPMRRGSSIPTLARGPRAAAA